MMAPSPSNMNMGMQGSPAFPGYVPIPVVASYGMQVVSPAYDLAGEFGQMKMERSQSRSPIPHANGPGAVGTGGSPVGKQSPNAWKTVNGGGSGKRH
jgi:hypothetical protein